MGGVSRSHLSRYKSLLNLSDEAIEMADRSNIEEALLRYVVKLHPDDHAEMIRQILEYNLTRSQVKAICEGEEETLDEDVSPREAVRFVRFINRNHTAQVPDVARILLNTEQDVHMARAKVQRLKQILDEVESYLKE
jgi:hypothetical protein